MASPAATAAAGLAALALAMGIGRFAFTPILPMMQADSGLSLAGGGWLAAANYAGYLLGALSATALRGAVAIRAGLVAIALATLAMGVERRFASWLALRAAAGVASAWVLIHISSWALERLTPLRRPGLNGAVYAGVGAGILLAGAACLALMALDAGAAAAWLLLGAVSLAGAAALWPLFDPPAMTRAAAARAAAWDAESIRLVLCYAAFGFGYIIPATFIPAMAREALGDPARFGWAWPLFGLAAAASTLAVAPLVRRFGNRAVWIGAQLVMALGVAAPLLVAGMAGILAAALCVGATFMVITMAGLQEGRSLGAARLMAAMTAGFACGQIAGPALVSMLAPGGAGMEQASLAACFMLVASACTLFFRSRAT